MPAYDYDCAACGRRFEVIHGVHVPGPTSCPLCGSGPVRKAITAVRMRMLDINVLMLVAAAGAVLLGQWAEAASVVFLFALAQTLEASQVRMAAHLDGLAYGESKAHMGVLWHEGNTL